MTKYRPLQISRLHPDTQLTYFNNGLPLHVALEDSALKVMTDLQRVPAVSLHPELTIDAALQRMVHGGVRMLFVLDAMGELVGMVTARDLMGEKPVRVATQEQMPRDEVRVADVMTRRGQIEVLDFDEVSRSTVGDLVLTMKQMGRQHALVEEKNPQPQVRGVFSVSQIARQLGVQIDTSGAVQSFSELEKLLVHHDS
ncbi:CBS domain-containing protein [Acidithiobacillus sp. CV18-2]|uniref:CBS domain-containing protein n=1 Tax=Igneacidithiobacillus copahuensis TaxID=2724909 RepID=A0AAE2YRY7_9PROT|nr:CBS domain-containing protein [Igneacidithiobacillus copahuensis]MBU2755634.1 CBS domain-containing protein [Acidithiobacillus sp. CV18-3]MBU2758020.1 CBS domain-containing protein [Acidithiobacillus sp. BN09-2]MBU2777374.1 CBS domain-containing protein [Acidithiobacillus sp. CV18-2]MBU2796876.1 CBS domain-containing protein [Acidithiobacillus sp. VAN18-2]MBU2799371.1 CBS domain-containing protein [Acidithiobacillus sp. VAN18-4]UTV79909.1 CBS domain-containing protein [Acidithiobacillus sp